MKLIGSLLLFIAMIASLQAGKIVWSEDGTPKIAGTAGKGCMESGLATTEERNTTKSKCS